MTEFERNRLAMLLLEQQGGQERMGAPDWLLEQQRGERLQPGQALINPLAPILNVAEIAAAPAVDAVTSAKRLYDEPSYPNAVAAGAHGLLAAFRPMQAAKLAGAGLAGALAGDAITRANALDPADAEKKLRAMSTDQIKAIQKELGIAPDGRIGSNTIDFYRKKLEKDDLSAKDETSRKTAAEAAAAAAAAKAQVESQAKAKSETEQRIDIAKQMLLRDLMNARTPVKDETVTGQVIDRLGAATPLLMGMLGGAVTRAGVNATGGWSGLAQKMLPNSRVAQTTAKVADDYVMPALGGMEGGSFGMSGISAQANRGDPTNPEYDAWRRYRTALPTDATREIAEADQKLGPGGIPRIDPAVTDAREQMAWNSPTRIGNAIQGGLGGILGGMTANAAPYVARGAGTMAKDAFNSTVEMVGEIPARLRAAYTNALRGSSGPGTGTANPPGNSPNLPGKFGSWARYPEVGSPQRQAVRDSYRDAVLAKGQPLEPAEGSRMLQSKASNAGGSLPNLAPRIKETNKMIDDFVTQNGRMPTSKAEWDAFVFKATKTLGIGGATVGAAAELDRILGGGDF